MIQFSSVAQSCPTLCNPMNRSTPGLPVHHQLPEFTQTHVLRVRDAIQPSHPLSSLLLLRPIPPSIRVFSNESTLRVRWPKDWSFSFSIITMCQLWAKLQRFKDKCEKKNALQLPPGELVDSNFSVLFGICYFHIHRNNLRIHTGTSSPASLPVLFSSFN